MLVHFKHETGDSFERDFGDIYPQVVIIDFPPPQNYWEEKNNIRKPTTLPQKKTNVP